MEYFWPYFFKQFSFILSLLSMYTFYMQVKNFGYIFKYLRFQFPFLFLFVFAVIYKYFQVYLSIFSIYPPILTCFQPHNNYSDVFFIYTNKLISTDVLFFTKSLFCSFYFYLYLLCHYLFFSLITVIPLFVAPILGFPFLMYLLHYLCFPGDKSCLWTSYFSTM